MREVQTIADLPSLVGEKLGHSEWVAIDQGMIDDFARVTGDNNWIHVDVERAKRELPDGRTIAHGMLTLAMVTHLGGTIFAVRERSKGINYGSNKVRFMNPVQSGARIRLHRTLKAVDFRDGAAHVTYHNEVEIEGESKLAMVAETISLVYTGETGA